MHTISHLTAAPFEQGFLNIPNEHINLIGNHLDRITIYLGNQREPIDGSLYTTIPRIYGGNLMKQWFEENCQVGQFLNVSIINPVTFWVYLNN